MGRKRGGYGENFYDGAKHGRVEKHNSILRYILQEQNCKELEIGLRV